MVKRYIFAIEVEANSWEVNNVQIQQNGSEDLLERAVKHCYWVVERTHPGKRFRIYDVNEDPFDLTVQEPVFDSQFHTTSDDESEVIENFMDKNHIGTCPNCHSLIDESCLTWSNQEDRNGNFVVILRFVCRECGATAFEMAEHGFVDSPVQVMEKYL